MSYSPPESLHEFVLTKLRNRGETSIREVAEGAGVPKWTVEKILSGVIADPGVSHCEKLAGYFRNQNRSRS